MPWPEPQISFQLLGFSRFSPKSIFDGSERSSASGSIPAAEIEGFR
jgi:hypothetical protein